MIPVISEKTIQKAELLAKKLDKMGEHFDIVESTINECTEYVASISEPAVKEISLTDLVEDEFISSEDMLRMLKEDFMSVRKTLLANIDNGKDIINAINSKLTLFDDDIGNAELVGAYATLMKTVNDSTKLIISLYKDIISTHQSLKSPENKNEKNVTFEGDVTINSISGNISDIIKQIKGER
jgi:hypothetical protein